jgi:hypothetical protein
VKTLALTLASVLAVTMFVLAGRFGRDYRRGGIPRGEYLSRTFVIQGCVIGMAACITFAAWNGPLDQITAIVPVLAGAASLLFLVAFGIRRFTPPRQP